jgi:hypothetical protein
METIIKNENEFMGKDYQNNLSQKTEEYLEFISFLLEAEEWDNEIVVIKSEMWDKFYETDDEDYEMEIADHFSASDFYDKFAKITKTDKWKFETCFVSAKYIDEVYYNTMNLIIKINDRNERFIIDIV